jgi:hypothetical protein
MSQYDFGIIDPYVTVGVELADMLNQWRDAMYSMQRGGARPAFVVPGQMWINDAGGPTNWIVNVYMSATFGDAPLFFYNTTTGAITLAASAGGTITAQILLAQANASPAVRWKATGNPIDQKDWRFTMNGVGALVLSSYNDAGVLVASITFNRDGSMVTATPMIRVHAAAGWSWGTTSFIKFPFDTVDFNINAGAFAGGNWTPPANSRWKVDCVVMAQISAAASGQLVMEDHTGNFVGSTNFYYANLTIDVRASDIYTFGAVPPAVFFGALIGGGSTLNFYGGAISHMTAHRLS